MNASLPAAAIRVRMWREDLSKSILGFRQFCGPRFSIPDNSVRSFARTTILAIIPLLCGIAITAQTVTCSGRVTEQASGQGISGAVVVGEGNLTGTRVAVTDAQGNYTLPFGANTNIRLRAYKTTYTFDTLLVMHVSSGPPLSGSFSQNFARLEFSVSRSCPAARVADRRRFAQRAHTRRSCPDA